MTFLSALDRIRRWRRYGRWLTALLGALALGCVLALLAGLADAQYAFEMSSRAALVTMVLGILLAAALVALAIASLISRRSGALTADDLLGSPRRPASAALDLAPQEDTPLARLLAERAQAAAAEELAAIAPGKIIAKRPIIIAGVALVIALLPVIILAIATPQATRIVVQRLLHPGSDLPPWSPLHFQGPAGTLSAVYGGDLPLEVEVTGAPLAFPVEVLIRRPGKAELLHLPCFRESDTRFSRTLESLTEPASIAFACGKARSEWMPVELLLQPKVLSGRVTVTPPAYTGREAVTAPLDSNEIAALEGSEITLELKSNRPLAPSVLVFTPTPIPGEPPVAQEIESENVSGSTVSWRWTAGRPGKLSATLRDVRGTPGASPLDLALKVVPDQPPNVDLSSPPRFLLATPDSVLQLAGKASDDFGLAKIQLVRTLQGFRDRTHVVAASLSEKNFDYTSSLKLGELGVSPGQVIELYLEASDHNPSLLGQGASEISRIQIISEEDYAARIRAKTTLEQFNARYTAIAAAREKAVQALREMDQANLAGDPIAFEEARLKALAAHEEAAALLQKLADDFPAFAMEQRLKDLAAKTAGEMKENAAQLGGMDGTGSVPDKAAAIQEMRDRLGAS